MSKTLFLVQILAVILLSIFSGALLTIAFVLVGFWQAIDPNIFLAWMSEHFFRLPTIMVPLNALAVLTTVAALAFSWQSNSKSRLFFGLATGFIFACSITFPIFFASANAAFLNQTIATSDISSAITDWSIWHWLRTSLAIFATIFASWGLYEQKIV